MKPLLADIKYAVRGWVWRRIDNAVNWWLHRDLERINQPYPPTPCRRPRLRK